MVVSYQHQILQKGAVYLSVTAQPSPVSRRGVGQNRYFMGALRRIVWGTLFPKLHKIFDFVSLQCSEAGGLTAARRSGGVGGSLSAHMCGQAPLIPSNFFYRAWRTALGRQRRPTQRRAATDRSLRAPPLGRFKENTNGSAFARRCLSTEFADTKKKALTLEHLWHLPDEVEPPRSSALGLGRLDITNVYHLHLLFYPILANLSIPFVPSFVF